MLEIFHNLRKCSEILLALESFAIFGKFWQKIEIAELCKRVHCVDLGESFQTHIYLQNLASIQPRTSPVKFRQNPYTWVYGSECKISRGEPRRSASPPHARASPRMRAALVLGHAASARLIIVSLASVESDGSFVFARLLIMFSEIYEHIKKERKPEATTIHVFMAFSFRRLIQIASRKMQTL